MLRGPPAPTVPMPAAASPSPRRSGLTQTPWTWQACGVTEPTSALKMTWPFSIRANAPPPRLSSEPRARGVGAPAPADRREAALLGEHGHAGGHQDVQLVRAAPPDQRVGRAGGG